MGAPSAAPRSEHGGRRRTGQQAGDPDKLARALLTIVDEDPPPRRFIAGADVMAIAERKIAELQAQIDGHRQLSTSLTIDPGPEDAD